MTTATTSQVRFARLVEFMVKWMDGARVSPFMAERFTRRCDTLASETGENVRRVRRMIRDAAEAIIVARETAAK